jgi:hypothetical protein
MCLRGTCSLVNGWRLTRGHRGEVGCGARSRTSGALAWLVPAASRRRPLWCSLTHFGVRSLRSSPLPCGRDRLRHRLARCPGAASRAARPAGLGTAADADCPAGGRNDARLAPEPLLPARPAGIAQVRAPQCPLGGHAPRDRSPIILSPGSSRAPHEHPRRGSGAADHGSIRANAFGTVRRRTGIRLIGAVPITEPAQSALATTLTD